MRIRPLTVRLVRRSSVLSTAAVTFLTTCLVPAIAWAQSSAPPAPGLRRTPAPWVGYLVIFVLLALVLAVSLIPSKRGHQD